MPIIFQFGLQPLFHLSVSDGFDNLLLTDLRLRDCLIFLTKSLPNLKWFIWKSVNRFHEYNRVSIQRYEFLNKYFPVIFIIYFFCAKISDLI